MIADASWFEETPCGPVGLEPFWVRVGDLQPQLHVKAHVARSGKAEG